MSSWTDASQKNYLSAKRKLALAKTSGTPDRIIKTVVEAVASFNTHGWPDSWSDWRRAYDDAVIMLQERRQPTRALEIQGNMLFP